MRIEDILKLNSSIPLSKSVVVNILYTSGFINSELNQLLKPKDISLQQFNVLRILRGQKDNAVTLGTIQERMITKMSNTTRLVDKLIKKKLVEKQINRINKRKVDINITTEGLNFLNQVDELIDGKEVEIVSQLTNDEALELIRLLSKLRLIAD